ncbi:LuxR C-terminal-related transcriptional regulator [Clostridium sp.]|uniref:response regulator transcription factor n=1 Tax=Clostridium sp. TaxID=1506 RepID=UPI0032169A6E
MGVTYFACPIFCHNDIVAICLGGGIRLGENKNLCDYKGVEDIRIFSEMEINDIVKMLENTFNLLNINEEVSLEKENNRENLRQELFLLKNKLSSREIEVVKLINAGLINKEISAKLNISEKTVKTHITNILRKLKLKNRLQVVIFCKGSIMS